MRLAERAVAISRAAAVINRRGRPRAGWQLCLKQRVDVRRAAGIKQWARGERVLERIRRRRSLDLLRDHTACLARNAAQRTSEEVPDDERVVVPLVAMA